MLDMIEEILPLGAEGWDILASQFNSPRNVNQRDADSPKAKSRSWKKARKPTGAKGGRERDRERDREGEPRRRTSFRDTHTYIYIPHTHTHISIYIYIYIPHTQEMVRFLKKSHAHAIFPAASRSELVLTRLEAHRLTRRRNWMTNQTMATVREEMQ